MDSTTGDPTLPQRALLAPCVWQDSAASAQLSGLVWSPDRRFAAYILTERREHPTNYYRASLCVIRANGPSARSLYSTGNTGTQSDPEIAAWSPDSQRLLFWKLFPNCGSANLDGAPLFDIAVAGGKPRLLTRSIVDQDNTMLRKQACLAFAPDGRHLLLVAGGSRFMNENKRIACLSYPRGKREWVTEAGWAMIEPTWSPDSTLIAFVSTPDPQPVRDSEDIANRESQRHLYVMNADRSRKRKLTSDPRYRENTPKWHQASPQAPRILRFTRDENSDLKGDVAYRSRPSLWEIKPDGTGLRFLRKLPPQPQH